MKSRITSIVLAMSLVAAGAAMSPAHSKVAKTYNFKVTGKINGAAGKTVLLVADTGRVLASQNITSAKSGLSLTSSVKTSNLNGATLQLVTTNGGDYYGPVVLGWKSKTKVYTKFGTKTSGKGKIKVGTIKVTGVTNAQGYGKVSKKLSLAKKTAIAAVSYKPAGVGTYGKSGGSNVSALLPNLKSFMGSNGDWDIRSLVSETEKFDGGDADIDGIPNAFDVNDDGDAVLDAADSNSPAPSAAANCVAGASFNVFTNFKATSDDFTGNVNAFGSGSYDATEASMSSALTNTLSIVMQPITNVCGSNVIKSEFKGVGTLPYAPSNYVDITGKSGNTGDYQWVVGTGQIGGSAVTGLSAFSFTSPNQISGQDVLMQRVTTADGNSYEFAGTMGFVFVTHPLPLSYKVGSNAWTDFTQNYGSINLASTDELTVRIAVPQRLPFDGEGTDLVNLGGLDYTPDVPNGWSSQIHGASDNNAVHKCDALATRDSRSDSAVVESSQTYVDMIFTLGTCYQSTGKTWVAGNYTSLDIQVVPVGGGGNSAQKLWIHSQ